VVNGRYRLARRIAGGGMGDVWRAHDETLQRTVAIKLLKPEYLSEPAFLERFRSEARLAGMLSHPGIAAVHDYGEDGGPEGSAWLVMELVEGEALSTLLHRRGALPPDQALDVVGQVALALQAAHDAGVVHRDVKPGNLLVRPDGVVKVTDFGIARATGSAPLTRTGTVLGTAHYLSPEQASGQPASPASDVYALGVVGYECLAGHRPFEGDSPVEVALAHQREQPPPLPSTLPAPVIKLIARALAKDPAARFRTAGALGRTALGIRTALYDGGPATGPPLAGAATVPATLMTPTPVPTAVAPTMLASTPTRRRPRRRLRLPLLVLAALLALVVVSALASLGGGAKPVPNPQRPPAGPAQPASNGQIHLDPASYRGRPVEQVLAALRALGLSPSRVDVVQDGTPGTVVTIVTPGGGPLPATLAPHASVVIQAVAAAAATPSASGDNGTGTSKGRAKDNGQGQGKGD
jgi:serine/threonine-protein kinase